MDSIVEALIPIISTIILGYTLKRSGCFNNGFWVGAETLTYYVLTPALLIGVLSNRPLGSLPWQKLLLVIIGTLLFCALIITFWQLFVRRHKPACFTSLFQGGVRFNTFIALALAGGMLGEEGLRYSSLAAAGMIILINILCVTAFSLSIRENNLKISSVVRQLAGNPLILGCGLGLLLNTLDIGLHSSLESTLQLIGRAAFPLGLLLVGAAMQFRGVFSQWELTLTATAVQFVIKPLFALLLIDLVGLSGTPAMVVVIFLCVPTAPAAYILARKMGGNSQAMAVIVSIQTLLAFVTLPVTLYLIPSL